MLSIVHVDRDRAGAWRPSERRFRWAELASPQAIELERAQTEDFAARVVDRFKPRKDVAVTSFRIAITQRTATADARRNGRRVCDLMRQAADQLMASGLIGPDGSCLAPRRGQG